MSIPQRQNNRLLASLPKADYQRLYPYLEVVSMKLSDVVHEADAVMRYAYFPIDCIVSILSVMSNGDSAEIAMVGNEGMVGVSLFMGGESTTSRALVQCEGNSFRLEAAILKKEFRHAGALQNLLLRYTQTLVSQITQTAACNLHHSVERQLSRWLLMSLDRLPSNRIQMTQGLIANMLGVRRAGASDAAGQLQSAGLIHYQDGMITVLDRGGLEAYSCECYGIVKRECDRLLPDLTTVE